MRVKKRRNDLFAAAIGVSIAFGGVCMTMAQEDAATSSAIRMPDGWGDQPLDVFLQQYRSLPDRPGARNEFLRVVAEDQRMPIADRAWVFLQNAQLIQEADWALVEELVASFANTAKWFSDGDERAALLSQRFSERLAAEGQAISGDYQRLNTHVAAMRIAGIADAETKINEAQLAWLQSHDLSEMPPIARMRAFEWPSVSESAISAEFVSARFSGFITVPAAGTYTFSAYRTDPLIETDPLRVLIDGVVVLDTSIASSDNSSESQTSIDLQSGAHPIVVEYRGYKKRGKRLATADLILLWDTPDPGDHRTVVPTSAYTTAVGGAGLDAAYYNNVSMEGEPALTGVIPGLQYLLGGGLPPLRHTELLNSLKAAATTPQAIEQWVNASGASGLDWHRERNLQHFTVEEAHAILKTILDKHPDAIAKLSPKYMSMPLHYLAAIDPDAAYSWIQVWSQGRPQHQTVPAIFKGNRLQPYKDANDGWMMDRWMLGGMMQNCPEVVARVQKQLLINSDGSCNINILKFLIAAFSTDRDGGYQAFEASIQAELSKRIEQNASGDAIASWHVAMANCSEYLDEEHKMRLLFDTRSFELAYAAAASDQARFWVLHEHAARLASLGRSAELEALLAAAAGSVTDAEQLSLLQACRDVADKASNWQSKSIAELNLAELQSAIGMLQDRLVKAQQSNDQEGIARFAPRVERAQAAYDQALLEYNATYQKNLKSTE